MARTVAIEAAFTASVTPVAEDTAALKAGAASFSAIFEARAAGVAEVVVPSDTARENLTSQITANKLRRRRAGEVVINKPVMDPPSSDASVTFREASSVAVGGASAVMLRLVATVTMSLTVG